MASAESPFFEAIEAMDLELARLAHASGALRCGLGMGLEALARISGHHELGFASVEAYALERCERSARWAQESRWLARRLEQLREVRSALFTGKISFSMAQCVAKIASTDDQARWLAEAGSHTVREMRVLARRRAREGSEFEKNKATRGTQVAESGAASGGPEGEGADSEEIDSEGEHSDNLDAQQATLTITIDREDAWLFECVRMMVQRIAGVSRGETIEALLGEGTTSLLSMLGRDQVVPFDEGADDAAQRRWEAQLSRWRNGAEARSEASFRAGVAPSSRFVSDCTHGFEFDFHGDAAALDKELRRLAKELAGRDIALGQRAEVFWKADGWRRLGYATATQYARERLGISLSAVKAKRALARRAERLPRLATAVASGELGYEAARLVSSVATADTVEEWVERAGERTLRYLREEVDAVEMFSRLAPGGMTSPPSEATMQELAALESRVVSGVTFERADTGQMSARPHGLLGARAPRSSAAARGLGRVTLHFRLATETRRYYRWLERLFQRHGPPRVHFLRFLCCALIEAWQHTLGSTAKYSNVYGRDRYRCSSPVCGRRGVTPHHLKFRSAGGDDSLENIASLCVWCHLEGIHGGRLRAAPPASDIAWVIGRNGHTVVRGRRRIAA